MRPLCGVVQLCCGQEVLVSLEADPPVHLRDPLSSLRLAGPASASRPARRISPQLRRLITWDQGWEMARHSEIVAATGTTVYFCDPHPPWHRGTHEPTNRLLRDYLQLR